MVGQPAGSRLLKRRGLPYRAARSKGEATMKTMFGRIAATLSALVNAK
jgi:hypothetical protein